MMKNLEEDFGLFELPKSEDQAKQILAEYQPSTSPGVPVTVQP